MIALQWLRSSVVVLTNTESHLHWRSSVGTVVWSGDMRLWIMRQFSIFAAHDDWVFVRDRRTGRNQIPSTPKKFISKNSIFFSFHIHIQLLVTVPHAEPIKLSNPRRLNWFRCREIDREQKFGARRITNSRIIRIKSWNKKRCKKTSNEEN